MILTIIYSNWNLKNADCREPFMELNSGAS